MSVDLILGLILPKELGDSHYADIEMITGFLTNDSLTAKLRSANSSSDLYDALLAGYVPANTKMQSAQTL
jgi:mannitol/fructose-specific phosphotransferase system IIA component (Ntr-type)